MSSTNTNGYNAERVTTSPPPGAGAERSYDSVGYGAADSSIGALIGNLLSDTTRLMRDEVRLAKAEVGEKAAQARTGAILIGIGIGTILLGAFALIASAVLIGIALGLAPWLSALIVGGIIALIGYLQLKKGISDLKAKNLAPTRTQANLSRDAHMVKETV